jgi:L-iditol 2-dehydrogenase
MQLPGTHLAAVRTTASAGGIAVQSEPVPTLGSKDVLVEVELCGLCGSDLHIWRGDDGYEWVPCGITLGHEIVGTVAAIGSALVPGHFAVGDRVVPIAQSGCGSCRPCQEGYANGCDQKKTLGLSRNGGAARFIQVPADQLLTVPAGIPARTAVLTEPLSVAARAVAVRGGIRPSDRVVISGPGTIGILCALVSQHLGAKTILTATPADTASKGALVRRLGLEMTESLPAEFRPTVWIEAAGAPAALEQGIAALPPRGRLIMVALYGRPPVFPANDAVRKELDIIPSYSSHRRDYEMALRILELNTDLGEQLVQTFPLSDIEQAFESIGQGTKPKTAVAP